MVGQPIDKHHQESWRQIELEIERFLSADIYVLSTPMWNPSIAYTFDFQEPYLRTIFGFVGIADLHFVNAQPMDISVELRAAAVTAAIARALALVRDQQ